MTGEKMGSFKGGLMSRRLCVARTTFLIAADFCKHTSHGVIYS